MQSVVQKSLYLLSQTISTHHQSPSQRSLPASHWEEARPSTRGEGRSGQNRFRWRHHSLVLRSISDNAEEAAQLRASMMSDQKRKCSLKKRYSGFLKKPDMLETVYSVEDPEDTGDVQFQLWNKNNCCSFYYLLRWYLVSIANMPSQCHVEEKWVFEYFWMILAVAVMWAFITNGQYLNYDEPTNQKFQGSTNIAYFFIQLRHW